MRVLILLFLSLPICSYATFEKITLQNLDFDYEAPHGKGLVERVGIGVSLMEAPLYEIEINRLDDRFDLATPYVDFSWINPLKFFYETEKFSVRKTSAAIGTKNHFLKSEHLMLKPSGEEEFKASSVHASCDGTAKGVLSVRLLEDCRSKMEVRIKEIQIPQNAFLSDIFQELPMVYLPEEDKSTENIHLNILNGDYFLQLSLQGWGLGSIRSWGHLQYENNHQIVAIRVDLIKLGYIPVTNYLLKKLKERVNNPNITIDPPWIRINLKGLNENF